MNAAQVMNLSQLLRQTATLFPTLPAVIQGEARWNWREIDQRVDAMAHALTRLGLKKGDRILVQSRNTLELFESCWVAFRLGCVWVPTNYRLTPGEVAYLAESSGARAMIFEGVFQDHARACRAASGRLEHLVAIGHAEPGQLSYQALVDQHMGQRFPSAAVGYGDPLWFFYTSGTTGKPKAAVLTHGQMAFVVTNHLADLIPGTTEKDCSIAVAPLSHGAGIHALLNVARGAATVLPTSERLDPEEVWRLIEQHRVTNLFTVPTIVKLLVEHPAVDAYDHSSVRYIVYAGAPMYRADQKYALKKLGKVLVQYFGLGEVTGCITVLPPYLHTPDDPDPGYPVGSCGRPRVGMEIAILDDDLTPLPPGEIGEICCRGPAVFAGYYNNEQANESAFRGGWFHTGDIGRLDDKGFLYITGRQSDMYISGGSNVYPREVEEVILTHPAVEEVAVVGVRDEQWGEVGVAVVVLRKGHDHTSPDELFAHLDGKCAKYRWPKRFVFWDALPKSGYGKITKKDVKRLLQESGEIELEQA